MQESHLSNILNRRAGAIYIRVSTDRQEELSPDAQRRLLLEYAKEHNIDVPIEYIFQDNGISGRQAKKRPAFQQMIALAKSKEHPIDAIIVWKFSRFARNQEESIVYKSLLKKNNVDVISISEPLADGPFGTLIERIIEWMDEYYSIRLSGEVTRGMTENAMRGNYQSEAPIGYRSPGGGKPPVVDEQTVQIPLLIKERFLSGATLLQIARNLNELGYRTKRGNLWDARGVRYVLENPFYAGKSRWNYTARGRKLKPAAEVIYADGNWEPIWDEQTMQQIQQRFAQNQRSIKSRDISAAKHWLSGLLTCSSCGATMAYGGAKDRRGFQCWKYGKGQCRESHFIRINQAEALTIQYLQELSTASDLTYTIVETTPERSELRPELEHQLQKLDAKEKRIKAAYQNGIDSLEEYKSNKEAIHHERQLINEALEKLLPRPDAQSKELLDRKMRENLMELLEIITDASIDYIKKGSSMRAVVDHIVFDRKTTSLDIFLKLVL